MNEPKFPGQTMSGCAEIVFIGLCAIEQWKTLIRLDIQEINF
jgi:hypothetical protein